MEFGFEILIILFMLVFNAFFAAYEMALASVSLARLRALAERKASGARAAVFMKEKMERSLAVVQLGITIVGAVAAATGGAGVQDTLVPWMQDHWRFSENTAEAIGVMLLVLPLSAVTILFGELLPKVFAIRNNEWVCLKLSPVMQVFAALTLPLTWLFEWAVKILLSFGNPVETPGSMKSPTQIIRDVQSTDERARDSGIALLAAELASRPAASAMIPVEAAPRNVPDSSIGEILVVAENDSLLAVLELMIREKKPVVSVQDKTGQVLGILTVQHIIARLVK